MYTDISPSVSRWVGVSRYISRYFTFSEALGGGFSLYIHWHFTFSEPLGGGFSLYTLAFHLQWVTGWVFLTIYTDISPSVSHWVGVSRYIHWHFTFSEHLGGGFSLYTLTYHLQWASGWGFLAIYTDISPSVSIWVGVSRYIHWHFTFSEHLGGGFSLYTLTFHLQWASGWGFLAIYTDISPSVSIWVGVSRYIHWHFTFSEHLGGGFSLYTLTFHLQWASGWGFLAIYTDISPSVSIWVGVSCYIYRYFTYCQPLGGGLSLYILIFHLQWASGWGFSLYILIFHLQWASGWGFLAIYTDISPSVSHWVGVSRYIHNHFTFSESLGGGFLLYTLTFHLQGATGWMFLVINTDISHSMSHWVGVSRYRIYTDISPSVSHWVGVSHYIHWHFTFSKQLGGGFSL